MTFTPILYANESAQFNTFLKDNAWWMALILAAIILVVILVVVINHKKKSKPAPKKKAEPTEYFASLGGEENIVSYALKGSRIEICLKDYSLLDKEKLKEAGVDGFILMSNKLTLVIKGDASNVYKALFGEEN